jgi:hypothetical protein
MMKLRTRPTLVKMCAIASVAVALALAGTTGGMANQNGNSQGGSNQGGNSQGHSNQGSQGQTGNSQ